MMFLFHSARASGNRADENCKFRIDAPHTQQLGEAEKHKSLTIVNTAHGDVLASLLYVLRSASGIDSLTLIIQFSESMKHIMILHMAFLSEGFKAAWMWTSKTFYC